MESAQNPGLSVHVKIAIDPSRTEAFFAALQPFFDITRAEPENIFCEIYADAKEPGVYKMVENWNASVEYMMTVQTKKPHYTYYNENVKHFYLKPEEVEMYRRLDGSRWASVKPQFYMDGNK